MFTKRILILDGDYNARKKIVKLLIREVEGDKELTLVLGDNALGPAFGVDRDLSTMPGLVEVFIKMLKGKEKIWQSSPEVAEMDKDDFNKPLDRLVSMHNHFEGYAYREILEEIQEESNQ